MPDGVVGGGWKLVGTNGDEQLLRGRVYGRDHDDPALTTELGRGLGDRGLYDPYLSVAG
ncbi:hypothetical protein ACH4ZU_07750 [Streptomyces sp. NPDC020472]|uniref:hypothetical protein n=1 Tax=Streptomyces sp. NPDC020472 TaxID=3365075 RepID=UPI00379E4DA2